MVLIYSELYWRSYDTLDLQFFQFDFLAHIGKLPCILDYSSSSQLTISSIYSTHQATSDTLSKGLTTYNNIFWSSKSTHPDANKVRSKTTVSCSSAYTSSSNVFMSQKIASAQQVMPCEGHHILVPFPPPSYPIKHMAHSRKIRNKHSTITICSNINNLRKRNQGILRSCHVYQHPFVDVLRCH